MKRSGINFWNTFLTIAFVMVFQACEEEPVQLPDPINPDDLRYEGGWAGSSSETKLLSLTVINAPDGAIVRECEIAYLNNKEFKQRQLTSTSGLSDISDGDFYFGLPDGGHISGSFETTTLCKGTMVIIDEISEKPSTLYFELIPDSSQTNVLSAAKASFSIDGSNYVYVQDDVYLSPMWENLETPTGLMIGSSFVKKDNATSEGREIIIINAGRINDPDDIPKVFAPGKKKYSPYAVDGIEINLYHPGIFFQPYSSSLHTGNQSGSNFEILDFIEIELPHQDYKLYKFSARFHCKVYRPWGTTKTLDDGFYIGYIDTRKFQQKNPAN